MVFGKDTAFASMMLQAAGDGGKVHWSLQHRSGAEARWLEVARFRAEEIAVMTRDALVADDRGTEEDFRIEKVTIPPRA
jgi:hypothetical protein